MSVPFPVGSYYVTVNDIGENPLNGWLQLASSSNHHSVTFKGENCAFNWDSAAGTLSYNYNEGGNNYHFKDGLYSSTPQPGFSGGTVNVPGSVRNTDDPWTATTVPPPALPKDPKPHDPHA